jgi:hypothetical protein
LKTLLVAFIVVFYSGTAFSAPDSNPSPRDRINVIGTIPDEVEAVVTETWQTTRDSVFCEKLVGEAGFSPSHFSKPAKMISTSKGQRAWAVWRDEVLAGQCGWTLKQIVVYLDAKASGLPPVRASNIPTRIAYVCGAREHCENDWSSNDDSAKPTHHFCKFSTVRSLAPGISKNPCVFFNEKYRGTNEGKYEHILRPDQRTVQFIITDLEQQTP